MFTGAPQGFTRVLEVFLTGSCGFPSFVVVVFRFRLRVDRVLEQGCIEVLMRSGFYPGLWSVLNSEKTYVGLVLWLD